MVGKMSAMRDLIILLVHGIATVARLTGPGGLRAVVAESLLVKHQLLILNRSRQRSPNLRASDRIFAGMCSLFMRPARVIRSAIVIRPSTVLGFHQSLRSRKYRSLFSPTRRRTGPKGPSKELVDAIVEIKRRNPTSGCPRIAQQITLACGADIDTDVVRRVLVARSRPGPGVSGPSWLTLLGHAKDSLWSVDLFRCESAILTGCWSSWTSSQDGSSASVSTPELLTVGQRAACSTARFAGSRVRRTDACRNAQPLPMESALPRTLSDADRGVTSGQLRRLWLASRLALFDIHQVAAMAKRKSASAAHLPHAIVTVLMMTPALATRTWSEFAKAYEFASHRP